LFAKNKGKKEKQEREEGGIQGEVCSIIFFVEKRIYGQGIEKRNRQPRNTKYREGRKKKKGWADGVGETKGREKGWSTEREGRRTGL